MFFICKKDFLKLYYFSKNLFSTSKQNIMPEINRQNAHGKHAFSTMLEGIPGNFFICDAHTQLLYWNAMFRNNMGGHNTEDISNKTMLEMIHPDDQANAVNAITTIMASGKTQTFEVRVDRYGTFGDKWWMITGERITHNGITCVAAVGVDITAYKRTATSHAVHRRLLEIANNHSLDDLLQATLDEVKLLTNSLKGFYHLVCPAEHGQLAWMQQKEPLSMMILHEDNDDLCYIDGALRCYNDSYACCKELSNNMKRSLWMPVMDGSNTVAILCVGNKPDEYDEQDSQLFMQLTTLVGELMAQTRTTLAQQTMEKKLLQSQEMVVTRTLTAGMAYNINNLVGIILDNVEKIFNNHTKYETPDASLLYHLENILNAGYEGAELITQLVAFSRQKAVLPIILELNYLVGQIIPMLQELAGDNITLQWIPTSEKTWISIDPNQIELLLINLCTNAREAITGQGTITIETRRINHSSHHHYQKTANGSCIMLVVNDDGCGIEHKDLAHIYEPFFTTKEQNIGRGMGLAAVYGIVKQSDAAIECKSSKGEGTTFNMWFPAQKSYADPQKDDDIPQTICLEKETILLVDDDSETLNICKFMLEHHGYGVLTASTPDEALRLAQHHHGDIHLLLTNSVLTTMNGCDLSGKLLNSRMNLKTLFMSNHSTPLTNIKENKHAKRQMLHKPFSAHQLIRAVHHILN